MSSRSLLGEASAFNVFGELLGLVGRADPAAGGLDRPRQLQRGANGATAEDDGHHGQLAVPAV